MKSTILWKADYFRNIADPMSAPFIESHIDVNSYLTFYDEDIDPEYPEPFKAYYRPSQYTIEGDLLSYGQILITYDTHYSADLFGECVTDRYVTPTAGGDPAHEHHEGVNAFGLLAYLEYISELEKSIILENMPHPGADAIPTYYLVNNIPIYDSEDPTKILGMAYKNGRFYDEPLDLDDPYSEDEQAEDEGGDGVPDWLSDPISERDLPPNFYGNSGLVHLFTPTTGELQALSSYIWGSGFDLDQFKKVVNNPFDLILALQYIPFEVTIAGQRGVNVGNILSVDTGLSMSYPTQENYIHDFGNLTITQDENAFVDYSPYSRCAIHLPFIGEQALDVDLIRKSKYMTGSFNLKYKYNIVNGTVVAYLYSSDQKLLYEWCGNVATPIPVASNDYTNTIGALVGMASSAVSGAVTGGTVGSAIPGVGTAVGATVGAIKGAIDSGASSVTSLKPTVTTSGGIGASGAVLNATNDAFITIETPPLSIANKHRHYMGYPRNTSGKIKSSKGYSMLASVRLGIEGATADERQEIEQILTSGYVYGNDDGTVISEPTQGEIGNGFSVGLYSTNSSNYRIDKKCTYIGSYQCHVKEDCSIQDPVIVLDCNDSRAIKSNYIYIPAFQRYYYVQNIRALTGNLWEFTLHVDVLMSFKNQIIDHTAVFSRSTSAWNLYLNDGSIQIDSRVRVKQKKFPNSLTNNGTYVLLMAGS